MTKQWRINKVKATTTSLYLKHLLPGITLFVLLSFFFAPSFAQSFNERIYRAYVIGDMELWEKIMTESKDKLGTPADRYSYALACYGLIGYWIGENNSGRVRGYLDQAENIVDRLIREEPDNPKYLSLRTGLYGFRLEYQPQKAPAIIPKASKLMELALERGEYCPEVWIEAGNREWFLPTSLGGSRIQGIHDYEKSILLMEKDSNYLNNNWLYLKSHKLLIDRYKQLNMTFYAAEACEKLLRIEPDFLWAKNELARLKTTGKKQ